MKKRDIRRVYASGIDRAFRRSPLNNIDHGGARFRVLVCRVSRIE
jgi:hypothetical protein